VTVVNLTETIEEIRRTPLKQRKPILQRIFGPLTESKAELHFRALLMTRLHEEKLWP
jgi:hypothetical protein